VIMLRGAHSIRHMEEQQRIHFVVVATGYVGAHLRPPIGRQVGARFLSATQSLEGISPRTGWLKCIPPDYHQ
jgi:hypothetical protein